MMPEEIPPKKSKKTDTTLRLVSQLSEAIIISLLTLVRVFRAAISHLCRLPKPLKRHEGVKEPEKNKNRHQIFQIELL